MTKIADTLIYLYKTALPFCQRKKISLNLDLADSTLQTDTSERALRADLTPHLEAAFARAKQGTITIGAHRTDKNIAIFIRDTGDAIPKNLRTPTPNLPENLQIRSRHGYGTTVTLTYPQI